jgi:AcrR family transcriptional regulator
VSFAEKGYRATTIRGVAAAAGVDAALVHHYFGTKDDLFIASLQIPADPREALASVFAAGTAGAGERLLQVALAVWDEPEGRRPLVAVVRDSLGERGGSLLRDGFLRVVLKGLREALPPEEAELRAQLVAAQMLGLVVTRYVLELEPLASLPRAQVVDLVAPTLQRYLDGPLAEG